MSEAHEGDDWTPSKFLNHTILDLGLRTLRLVMEQGAERGFRTDQRATQAIDFATKNKMPWLFRAEVLRLAEAAAIRRDHDLSPAERLLQAIVKLEMLVRVGRHEGEELPADLAERSSLFMSLSMAIGILAHDVFGSSMDSFMQAHTSKAGRASGPARQWWWKIALPRAQSRRQADPATRTAELARLLKRELEKTFPQGRDPETGKSLPETEKGYRKAIEKWERLGELPRSTPEHVGG